MLTIKQCARTGVLLGLLSACAAPLGDVDRTQPNRTRKSDLDGTWYYMQTVTAVPPTSLFTFIGETSRNEKIRWQFQEKYLVGYRSYPLVPGSERPSTAPSDLYGGDYHENPVVAYAIESHFDIQREYNAQTGEQTNVLVENSTDRPWFERTYARVDWSRNLVTNFDFISHAQVTQNLEYFIPEEAGGEDAMVTERDGHGKINYFDYVGKMFVEPDLDGCWYTWMGWAAEDCTAGEVKVRHSFSRAPDEADYEPFQYDDVLMTKFGFFRSERVSYDERTGLTDSGRLYMINRHNVFKGSYQRDGDGTFKRDDKGKRIPIPLSQREVRTVPYYLSDVFPVDATLWTAGVDTVQQWSTAVKTGLAQAMGKSVESLPEVFVLCHNPVQDGDPEACGGTGKHVRTGDLRASMIGWVDASQLEGPLGYGPAATDPVTGEILSGKAYIYGAELNLWSENALDVIRFVNNDLEVDDLVNGTHVRDQMLHRLQENLDDKEVANALERIRSGRARDRLLGARGRDALAKRQQARVTGVPHYDPRAAEARAQQAASHGLGSHLLNDELRNVVAGQTGTAPTALTPAQLQQHDPTALLDPVRAKQRWNHRRQAIAHSVTFAEAFDTSVVGLAHQYQGRTDYDVIFQELRALIFKSTAIHEMGHTVGLRHNFQGSYDSINYGDKYWELRPESFQGVPQQDPSVADLYRLNRLTTAQQDGQMRDHQYASIMDYNYSFHSDLMGLGKYDVAAVAFGYTCGHDVPPAGQDCTTAGATALPGGGCVVDRPGVIEVFKKRRGDLGAAGEKLAGTETRFGLSIRYDDSIMPNVTILEREHYTTVARAFPEITDIKDREWMRFDEYLKATGRTRPADSPVPTADPAQEPVRVPYLFCSDEWEESLMSCLMYDQGADPFEQALTYIRHYRSFYYFDAFRRDRFGWDPSMTLDRFYERYFLPLSDLYQFWYFAEEGRDPVLDTYFYMATYSAFNLLAEVMATPPYGPYCLTREGDMMNLSSDPSRRDSYQDYLEQVYCASGVDPLELLQGDGRRRFSRFDFASGYYAFDRPQEAGHYWATTAAVWALTDPDASIIGTDADSGTYAITFYDFFADEMSKLFNSVVAEDYTGFGPVFRVNGQVNPQGQQQGQVVFLPQAPFWGDNNERINPETGELMPPPPELQGGSASLCDPCSADAQCAGHTGTDPGTVSCQDLEGLGRVCVMDCSGGADAKCPSGTTCDGQWCWPNADSCDSLAKACNLQHPLGRCPAGLTCMGGTCTPKDVRVQTDVTYMLADDVLFWGMIFTTSSFSTRFNDQLQVFRMGTGEELTADGQDFEVLTFTDPLGGQRYGTLAPRCTEGALGGPVGLCTACDTSEQCAGYLGNYYGGVFCEDRGLGQVCIQDCGDGTDAACPAGTTCHTFDDGEKFCLPAGNTCQGLAGACSAEHPLGTCADGSTCVEGTCVAHSVPSARCRYGLDTQDSGGVLMVKRGQQFAREYEAALDAYWSYDGGDPAEDERLWNLYGAAHWRLERLVEMIGLTRAYFNIFGMVY